MSSFRALGTTPNGYLYESNRSWTETTSFCRVAKLHVLLPLGSRCVAVCVEHNKEIAEGAQAAIPQSVRLEFVDKLNPKAFVGLLSRRSFNLCSSGEALDTVQITDVTDLALLSDQLDILLNLSGLKSVLKNECALGVFLDETQHIIHLG